MMIGTGAVALANGETVKLVNKKTGFVVVEFLEGKAIFHDRFLEPEMRESGIAIPHELKPEFENKDRVLLEDPLFEKAFKEIYYRFYIPHSIYDLVE
jgi:hypothetical protein